MSNEKTSTKRIVIAKLAVMAIIIIIAAFLGQLIVPALMKAIFL